MLTKKIRYQELVIVFNKKEKLH